MNDGIPENVNMRTIIREKWSDHAIWQFSNLFGLFILFLAPYHIGLFIPQRHAPALDPELLVLTGTILGASAGISYLFLGTTVHRRLKSWLTIAIGLLLIVSYATLVIMWAFRSVYGPNQMWWTFSLCLFAVSWFVSTFIWWHERYLVIQKPTISETAPSNLLEVGKRLAAQSESEFNEG